MTYHKLGKEDLDIRQKSDRFNAIFDSAINYDTNDTVNQTDSEPLSNGNHKVEVSDNREGQDNLEGSLLKNIQEDSITSEDSIGSSPENLTTDTRPTTLHFEGVRLDERGGANESEANMIAEQIDSQSYEQAHNKNDVIHDICPIIGHIDGFKGGELVGWIFCASSKVMPQLYVDGEVITQLIYPTPRPDVNESLGFTGDCGFTFKLSGVRKGAVARLCATLNGHNYEIASYVLENSRVETNFIKQLDNASRIARQTNAVAITCWEGAHNPIGRAKVLYDVASVSRPCVLICYIFGDFGTDLWAPLIDSSIDVLTIPWVGRQRYHRMLAVAGVSFDTVWVCKPRLPSFELAKIVANKNAAIVLDIDDNEDHFSTSAASTNKAYGVSTINYANFLTEKVAAKTAASISLAQKYGASIVRHAREEYLAQKPRRHINLECDIVKIGFIGTARSHKNLVSATQALKCFSWSTGISTQLHIYGDLSPKSLVTDLEDNGAIVRGIVPVSDLHSVLAEMDVILTGFPIEDEASKSVTDFQISSKIADGLAVGRPVLVPETPSVVDLHSVEGVYLFNESSFSTHLYRAINSFCKISLPSEFSLQGAWKQFSQAEKIAQSSNLAHEVFDLMPTINMDTEQAEKTLVLLWKQNDSDCYGRRVDQIARSYKKQRPDERVIILELLHKSTENDYIKLASDYISEYRMLVDQFHNKQKGYINQDGVEFHQLKYKNRDSLDETLQEFLVQNLVLPEYAVFILFPIIQFYENIERTLSAYPKIVDVVDNQCFWGKKEGIRDRMNQYRILFNTGNSAVFNSAKNQHYFLDEMNQASMADFHVIPNWYQLPYACGYNDERNSDCNYCNVIYSGNMNDRIDWELLESVVIQKNNVILHLVGTANRSIENLKRLTLNKNVIYHGPLSERDTLNLVQKMDLAIMPHKADEISKFMNPLKVHMYSQLGIHTLSSKVEGINLSSTLTVASSREDFIDKFNVLTKTKLERQRVSFQTKEISLYISVIDSVREPNKNPVN